MHLKGSGGENQKSCKTPTKSEFFAGAAGARGAPGDVREDDLLVLETAPNFEFQARLHETYACTRICDRECY
jgi:hypothetical protein